MNPQTSNPLPAVNARMQRMVARIGLTPFPAKLTPAARSLGLDADANLSTWAQGPEKRIEPLVDMSSTRRTVRMDEAGSRYVGEVAGVRLTEPVGARRGLLAEMYDLEHARGMPMGRLVEDTLGGNVKSFFSDGLERFSARDVLKVKKSGGGRGNAIGYMMLCCDRAARVAMQDQTLNDAVPRMLYSMASMFRGIRGINDILLIMAMSSALLSERFAFAALAGDMTGEHWGWLSNDILRPVERSWEIAVRDVEGDADDLLARTVVRRMVHSLNARSWSPLASIYEDLADRSSDPFEKGMNMARSAWALMQEAGPHSRRRDYNSDPSIWGGLFLEPLEILIEGRGVSDELMDIYREAMRFNEAAQAAREGPNGDSELHTYRGVVDRLKKGRIALGQMDVPPAKMIDEMERAGEAVEQMLKPQTGAEE